MTPVGNTYFGSIRIFLSKGKPDIAVFEVELHQKQKKRGTKGGSAIRNILPDSDGRCQIQSIPRRTCEEEASVDVRIQVLLLPIAFRNDGELKNSTQS